MGTPMRLMPSPLRPSGYVLKTPSPTRMSSSSFFATPGIVPRTPLTESMHLTAWLRETLASCSAQVRPPLPSPRHSSLTTLNKLYSSASSHASIFSIFPVQGGNWYEVLLTLIVSLQPSDALKSFFTAGDEDLTPAIVERVETLSGNIFPAIQGPSGVGCMQSSLAKERKLEVTHLLLVKQKF